MFPSWLTVAFWVGAMGFFVSPGVVFAQPGLRKPASPGYRNRDVCPGRCSLAGPNPGNWSLYHNFEQIESCPQIVFYDFSLYDAVDNPDTLHRIYACTSFGPDWTNLPNATSDVVPAGTTNATYQLGWFSDGSLAAPAIRSLSKQMRLYLASGYGTTNRSVILFARSGQGSVGLYIGKGLQNEGTSSFALKALEDNIQSLNVTTGSLAMQLCQPGDDGDHIFGLMATSNTTFTLVQEALQSWSNATCLSFSGTKNITGPAFLITPSVISINATNSTTASTNSTSGSGFVARRSWAWPGRLVRRADCSTIQVASGDGCASLATKCGISGADFTTYNPSANFCASLQPLQHVCCSAGTLPDFTPKPNPDGSCATYTIQSGDSCGAIAAANSITVDQLGNFNAKTWAWGGCLSLYVGTLICLSSGTPPMPAPVANAVCGPQVAGTTAPPPGTDISTLNPCPLNACCDVWGQCGITAAFCTDTHTGAPGTAAPGTNGCISNCGTTVVSSGPPATYRKVAYFEGFDLGRPCLYQDTSQIASGFTHLHFGFGILTADYQVQVGDVLSAYEFKNFKLINGPARILSFGGWTFSTDPSTYTIFRNGVKPENRNAMATSIANFIIANNLDGVDIDWEYPGAPDIPGIPAADPDDGENYLAFLSTLKSLLPGKSVSIAAPSSYWYLKNYPIAKIAQVIDYIVFMSYDLHGQWDAGNPNSQEGCPSGSCLRSDVNVTETMTALAMITKAGVPSNKVVVGITSYGRSFAMADPSCHTENCLFTGTNTESNAWAGPCTVTAGYISDAEIKGILADSSRVNQNYIDDASNTNILVFDSSQWVGYLSPEMKSSRQNLYMGLNMGGTTDWATDLEDYHDVPPPAASWGDFILQIKSNKDPFTSGPRTGNWTTLDCSNPGVMDMVDLTPAERWAMLDAADAWADVVNAWKTVDKARGMTFTQSVLNTIHGAEGVGTDCGSLRSPNVCSVPQNCDYFKSSGAGDSGAASYLIWNSLVEVHSLYDNFHTGVISAAATTIDPALADMETTFAPVPPPFTNTWVQVILSVISMGATMLAAPLFNQLLKDLPYFVGSQNTVDTLKDSVFAIIQGSTSIASDLSHGGDSTAWTPKDQNEFSGYMGQVLTAWATAAEQGLGALFNGNDASIDQLTTIISDGKMIEGKTGAGQFSPIPRPPDDTIAAAIIAKAFFAYAIPALWTVSKAYPFVIDSGYDCTAVDPLSNYLDTDTMHRTAYCTPDNKLYYLAGLGASSTTCNGDDGTCSDNMFSALPGLNALDGKRFGGITIELLVKGSVRTYLQNGGKNGGSTADPFNKGTFGEMFDEDVTTPGYVRIPVCSPAMAFAAWNSPGSSSMPNYPCVVPQGFNLCGTSTFVSQTSDASPLVADCRQIVANLEQGIETGDPGKWELENVDNKEHQELQTGTCKFSVKSNAPGNGNVDYFLGSQDIIDILNMAIQQFGGSGKVGATGVMNCNGNIKQQSVTWRIF